MVPLATRPWDFADNVHPTPPWPAKAYFDKVFFTGLELSDDLLVGPEDEGSVR